MKESKKSPKLKHAQESQGGVRDVGQHRLVPSGEFVIASRTSGAHGAGANGLKKETKEPGECQNDKTCGQKRAGTTERRKGRE